MKFRVIGFGPDMADAVKEVENKQIPGVKAQVVMAGDSVEPEKDDTIAVFLAENTKGIEPLLHKFYDAGVLTLLISTQDNRILEDIFDGFTIQNRADFAKTVEWLISSVIFDGRIHFDFSDIEALLRNSGRFYVAVGSGSGETRIAAAVKQADVSLNSQLEIPGHLVIILSHNEDILPRITMGEIADLSDYINIYSRDADVQFAIQCDSSLPDDKVFVTLLAV